SILAEWPFTEKLAVQDGIVRYFESRITVGDEMQRLILLFSDLLERRVISYSWLLRRCIARGWTQNSVLKSLIGTDFRMQRDICDFWSNCQFVMLHNQLIILAI